MEQATSAPRGEEIVGSTTAGLVPALRGHTVLVLGDVMLDRYGVRRSQPDFSGGPDPGAAGHRVAGPDPRSSKVAPCRALEKRVD